MSEKEFVRGSLACSLGPLKRRWFLYVIAFGLIVTSMVFNGRSVVTAIGLAIGGAILLVGLVYVMGAWRIKKIFREQTSLREAFNVTIDDQQLSYSWVRGSYVLPWANVRQWMETKNFFILFESSYYGRLLPKRALSPEETAIIGRNTASKPRR